MKVLGNFQLKQYSDHDERPHARGTDTNWQESVLMCWYDAKAGIGGLQRIGHEPNKDQGYAVLWSNVFLADGTRYRRFDRHLPLGRDDILNNGFGAAGTHRFVFAGRPTWSINDGDLSINLEVHNYFQPIDPFKGDMGTLTQNFAPDHFESAGRVVGEAVIAGRKIAVDGMCYRDHSWGVRQWSGAMLLNHRWFVGTFGPQLSFGITTWHDATGGLSKFGFVVRGDEVAYTDDVDVVVFMEADGITHRGGEVVLKLSDGSRYDIRCRAVDGAIFVNGHIACLDTVCEAECNGLSGFCDGEISTNPRFGEHPVTLALRADIGQGLRLPGR
jgi:hypothetical protein